jgi:hypothetical protein
LFVGLVVRRTPTAGPAAGVVVGMLSTFAYNLSRELERLFPKSLLIIDISKKHLNDLNLI